MKEEVKILRRAQKLIDIPEKWTKYAFARTAKGDPTDNYSRYAKCFCIYGAIHRAASQLNYYNSQIACIYLQKATGIIELGVWNDAPERTHADVMAAFTKAIELAGRAAR